MLRGACLKTSGGGIRGYSKKSHANRKDGVKINKQENVGMVEERRKEEEMKSM